jgi:hypothetical protein
MGTFEDWVAEAIKASVRGVAERLRAKEAREEADEREDIAYALSVQSKVALRKGVEARVLWEDNPSLPPKAWGEDANEGEL